MQLDEKLLRDRIVMLGMPITDEIASAVVAKLLHLRDQDPIGRIRLYINSPGGLVNAADAILDAMAEIEPPVSTVVLGRAEGVAVWVAAAGDAGHRRALCGAWYSMTPFEGGDADLREDVEARFIAQLASRTGRREREVRTAMAARRRFLAHEALAWGLVDALIDRP